MSQNEANEDIALSKANFLNAMRRICGTVAVVTTAGVAGRHGTTVSSFCSVSADPPALLVCLHSQSRIASLVNTNGQFCINVLSQDMKEIAEHFAGKNDAHIKDRFEKIDYKEEKGAPPMLSQSISFQCALNSSLLSGSHRVLIGEVNKISGLFDKPLTYLNGEYHGWSTDHTILKPLNS